MEKINISAVQMNAKLGDKKSNIEKIKQITADIKDTDVIILPEVFNIGWDCDLFENMAEAIENSPTLEFLKQLAKEKKTNIIGGSFISRQGKKLYNTCPVIDRSGNLKAIYNKNHLFTYYGCEKGKCLTSGESPVMVNLDGVNFGLTICYDIRFPEIYRAYRKAGADILVNCAAWASTKPVQWEVMTKSRAVENQTFVVAVNQFGLMKNNEHNLGHSRIIDYNGGVISEILEGEGFIQADVNLREMYEFREKCTVLNDLKKSYEVTCIK